MPVVYQYPIKITLEAGNKIAYERIGAFIGEITENVKQGRGLYLWGHNTGTGKTLNACRAMSEYFKRRAFESNLECLGVFINIPTFLEDIRKSYDKKEFQEDILPDLLSADIVIFDDIGAEKPSEWVKERLYTIINQRVDSGQCNIFTSNLSLEKIEDILGSRIASRIYGCTEQIELKGRDWRKVGDK
jgi:DNA replication protein DnaC